MYQKIITRPRKWNERSLALATKEELIVDLLIRKQRIGKQRKFFRLKYFEDREDYWIEKIQTELKQRQEWIIE